MPYGIVTIGPAGVGKTTMCHALQVHGQLHKRGIFVVNLDPAADLTPYEADVDVRELISAEDAMREPGAAREMRAPRRAPRMPPSTRTEA